MRLKLKFGAIRGVVRGVDVFEWVFSENKTPDCESDVLWMGYYSFIVSADNQFDSGFAMRRALLYAISNVKQVCP